MSQTTASLEDRLSGLQQSSFSGALALASREQLEEYAAALCHQQAYSHFGSTQFAQICETVRLHLLRAHIDTLDRRSAKTQRWFMALAVASLLATFVQVWVALATASPATPSSTTATPQQALPAKTLPK